MKLLTSIMLVAAIIVAYAFSTVSNQNDPWPVPEKYEKMKNPIDANDDSIDLGKSLYAKHCQSCHGKEGLGDGSKAEQLDTPSGDFTSKEFKSQSDGSMFYKTFEGRGDMPGYSKKIPEAEDMWSIVNYMRTFE